MSEAPVTPPIAPMLAILAREMPSGAYLYEPKWDGFRALVFRDGDKLTIQSRNQKPLNRYFPELVEALPRVLPEHIVLDGEIVIATPTGLDFEALLQRIHPAASRAKLLAQATPASLVAFDLLALGERDLRSLPMAERRIELERALAGCRPPLYLTPATTDEAQARLWFTRFEGAGLDGVMAKPLDLPYVAGERVLTKIKHQRTADCVIAGYRLGKDGKGLASLLLGLFDAGGTLHHVGVASGMAVAERRRVQALLEPLAGGAGPEHPWHRFGGVPGEAAAAGQTAPAEADTAAGNGHQRMPGGQSRWTGDRDLSWVAVRPELVGEVAYDHMQGTRFRHATRLVRLRPDRDAASCTYAQLEVAAPAELAEVFGATGAP